MKIRVAPLAERYAWIFLFFWVLGRSIVCLIMVLLVDPLSQMSKMAYATLTICDGESLSHHKQSKRLLREPNGRRW